jgi:hypothetical protein
MPPAAPVAPLPESFAPWQRLFDVLHLLAHLLDENPHIHGFVRSARVSRLGGQRICLPADFLQKEIHLLSGRFAGLERGPQRHQMGFQPIPADRIGPAGFEVER